MDREQSTVDSHQLSVERRLLQVTIYKLQGAEETQAEDTILTPSPSLRSGEGSKDSHRLRRLFNLIKQDAASFKLQDDAEAAGVVSDPALHDCDEMRLMPTSRVARLWLRCQFVFCWAMERIGGWFRRRDEKPFRVTSYQLRVDDAIQPLRGLPEPLSMTPSPQVERGKLEQISHAAGQTEKQSLRDQEADDCWSVVGRRGKSAVWVLVLLVTGMLLMVSCSNNTPTIATYTPPAVQPKILATVYISPTPNAEQQQALAAANPPTATPMVIPTVTPTPYIGVFLGEVDSSQDGGAVIPPALLSGPTSSVPVTVAVAPACPSQPDVAFGSRWAENVDLATAIGCPIEGAANLQGTYQIFERGVMYYSPSGEIWAIAPAQNRFWYAANAPAVQQGDIIVPEGMLAPSQGFGAVWRGLPGVQDALGFARTPEQGTKMVTQKLQNGLLLADGGSGQVFALLSDGRAMGPY
jgi:hypothetical protein